MWIWIKEKAIRNSTHVGVLGSRYTSQKRPRGCHVQPRVRSVDVPFDMAWGIGLRVEEIYVCVYIYGFGLMAPEPQTFRKKMTIPSTKFYTLV